MGYEQIPGTYNGFNYAMGNPINLSDPSGLHPWPGIELMARCFDLHSLRHGAAPFGPHDPRATTTAKEAVELCRASYNKENWNKGVYGFELGQDLPKTAHELFGWYVHEWRGKYKSDRLLFDANEPLTRELAQTCLVNDLRQRYHRGEDLRGPTHEKFKYLQFIETGLLDISSFGSVPGSFFMGSFWYQVKAVDGDVGFRIDNDITLESGSHIAGRFREDKFIDNVEDLISDRPDLEDKSLAVLIGDPEQYRLISILGRRTKEETEGSQGGGNLYQTFTWIERHDCSVRNRPWQQEFPRPRFDIQVWGDFRRHTRDPEGFPPEQQGVDRRWR